MASLGLGILSWRGRNSLRQSLQSYAKKPFLDLFDEVLIVFQECEEADKELAAEFGMPCKGYADNQGILGGIERVVDSITSDYLLLMEEDWQLVESLESAKQQIHRALEDITAGRADLYCLRHRWKRDSISEKAIYQYRRYYPVYDSPLYGQSSYLHHCFTRVKRRLHPVKARRLRGRAVYVESTPEHIFPTVIERDDKGHCFVDSAALDWSNNNVLTRRDFIREKMIDFYAHRDMGRNGFIGDIEHVMQCACSRCRWWQQSHFKIGISDPGLFRHGPVGYQQKRLRGKDGRPAVGNM
ncbi:MAG: hypothetical protein GDA50_08810 [Alphaproteobacteria bacterium GM202ARS2]|nr:hypothetical protein [Alphaproteobacteria bacterium GM202ARS2]